jgi:hypothetical protein
MPLSGIKADIGYTPAAKAMHWLVVALLFCQYAIAWSMPHIGRDTKPERMISLHFSFGVLILLVLAVGLPGAGPMANRGRCPASHPGSCGARAQFIMCFTCSWLCFRSWGGRTPHSAAST